MYYMYHIASIGAVWPKKLTMRCVWQAFQDARREAL